MPFAEWLDGTAQGIIKFMPDYIGLVAVRDEDGLALTSYFNSDVGNKATMITHMISDAIIELIENNADTIRSIILDDEDAPEDDDVDADGEDDEWQDTQLR